jgi:hypothetical protein
MHAVMRVQAKEAKHDLIDIAETSEKEKIRIFGNNNMTMKTRKCAL